MTTITIERELLEEVVEMFDNAISTRYPHEILRDIRAALSAPATAPKSLFAELIAQHEGLAEELAATAPATAPEQPAWHGAPTCAGVWLSDRGYENPYRWGTYNVVDPAHEKGMTLEDERWFGPIPEDKP